jgi:uncharacterized glyoxalase superfamily protein PhnB
LAYKYVHSPTRPKKVTAMQLGYTILYVPDVPATLKFYEAAIAAGAQPMRPVEVMPWGQTMAYVADINGFLVELCTPMG